MTRTRDEFREALARSLTTEIGVDWDADIEDRDKLFALLDRSAMVTYDKLIEEISDQAAALRERNRMYGKASETIGQLRADIARLRLERAEWRGTVNGDVLVEVLSASAPEGWTPEDRRAHAEHVIEAMQASGIEVRRPVRPWTPEPGGLALVRHLGPLRSGLLVRVDRLTENGNYTWDSVDGKVVGASAPAAFSPAPESAVDGVA